MKKYVLLENIGHWEYKGGKKIIYGTVERIRIAAESDNLADLKAPANIQYSNDGNWHSFSIAPRKYARKILK